MLTGWIILSLALATVYALLIGYFIFIWEMAPEESAESLEKDLPFVSVIIVGRNEATNLTACLVSIASAQYPPEKLEIIYVDDHSEDDSLEVLTGLAIPNLIVLSLSTKLGKRNINSYKKAGIALALERSKGELILHTDADCVVGPNWIQSHALRLASGKTLFAAAPVFITLGKEAKMVEWFQYYDFISTMGVTGAGIMSGLFHMANGANMSYDPALAKSVRIKMTDRYASGDDMFLVHEAAAMNQERVIFITGKEAIVQTSAEKSWLSLFSQRIRWAGKTRAYRDHRLQQLAALTFLVNAWLLLNLFFILIMPALFWVFLIMVLVKWAADLFFIRYISRRFLLPLDYRWLLPCLLIYPVYFVSVGLLGLFAPQYTWKGRKVR